MIFADIRHRAIILAGRNTAVAGPPQVASPPQRAAHDPTARSVSRAAAKKQPVCQAPHPRTLTRTFRRFRAQDSANPPTLSTGGQVQHLISGWNHGTPPYPYIAVIDESAPTREKGRFGADRPKRRLAPHSDPRRFETAREMHRLRREEHLKGGDIIAILAAEPDL
ncbi:hypothetical protein ACIBSV_42900 [Embleya sp. NPDC050154]|uniref:hypothetical protein n=1 Tax=Embleya sp. NPDC050154 TaxID=3363988 RepID=UPI0037A03DF1